jgi:hypothetical protein
VFSRISLFLALISVFSGGIVFFIFRFCTPLEAEFTAAGPYKTCVILTVDESMNDRLIREKLENAGMGSFISESSQNVPMDDFGILKMVRLDSFRNEIEEFDPRDNGYAEKLRSFFVHNGKRFFFSFPQGIERDRTGDLKKKAESALEGTSFALTVTVPRKPFYLYFVLLALGCVFTLYLSRAKRLYLYQFPLLAAMGWGGSSALILAAVFSSVWELLRQPFGELFSSGRYERRSAYNYAGSGFWGGMERLKPFRLNIFIFFFFLLFLVSFSLAGVLPSIPAAGSTALFFFLCFFSFFSERERERKNQHVLFGPVLLFPVKFGSKPRTFSLFPFILPFASLSLLSLFFPHSSAFSAEAFVEPEYFVSSEDYYRHVSFQRSFSYRSLNQLEPSDEGNKPLMEKADLRYYLGEDGLIETVLTDAGIAGEAPVPPFGVPLDESPAFPLEELMEFLLNYSGKAGDSADIWEPATVSKMRLTGIAKSREWISVGIIFMVCMMDLIRFSPKKKAPAFGYKRIAA